VEARIKNIEMEGAKVVIVNGTYDDCVTQIANDAKENNWVVISDTAYDGYTEIPKYIMAGYTGVFRELDGIINMPDKTEIDFVFMQTGVGGFTGAGMWYYSNKYGNKRPKLISVEPTQSDCFLESIRFGNGNIKPTRGNQQSIMAGLNCGVPSIISWPIIRDAADLFISITDIYAEMAIRQFYYPVNGDKRIISCESGAAGMAGFIAMFLDEKLSHARKEINLNDKSRVLIINTEGDTDPANFKTIVNKGPLYY
ncbi:MAG TPA: pyridoxal-phosphate dependent enzyme, partial [Bacteroidales bacterium]|nr:pyridoxal-phosphate dependent enzyme [Bacteroidales bacterium]